MYVCAYTWCMCFYASMHACMSINILQFLCNVHVLVMVWFDVLDSHDTDTSDRHRKSEYWDSKDKHPREPFSLPTAQSQHLTVFPFLSRCWRAYWCFLMFANQGKRKSETMKANCFFLHAIVSCFFSCIYVLFHASSFYTNGAYLKRTIAS